MKRSILVIMLIAMMFPGCGEQNLQSPILIRISDINEGSPTLADVLVVIDKGNALANPPKPRIVAIPTSVTPIRITNKPYSTGVITEPTTFVHDFQLTSYEVTWRRADGGATSGVGWILSDFDFEAGTTEIIPVNSTVELAAQIVPVGMKSAQPWVNARNLIDGGSAANFRLIADIVFFGHIVSDPTKEVRFEASTTVEIADFAD